MTVPRRSVDLANFARRLVLDAVAQASAGYWRRRSAAFEAAAPRPADFNGRATRADLAAARARCLATADACRAKAFVVERYGLGDDVAREVADELAEAS